MAAQALYECPACESCENVTLPTVKFDDCLPEANHLSEISDVYFSLEDPLNAGVPLTGAITWSDAAAIETAIDGINGFRMTVIGDKPEADDNTRTISKGRIAMGPKVFNVNFTVDETNDDNYNAMRKLECGGEFIFWYVTRAGKVYGGANGIKGNLVKADNPLDRGENTYDRFEFQFRWMASCNPPREAYALAESNSAPAVV